MILSEVKNIATSLSSRLSAIRRHLHQYPELSFREYETSQYIISVLDEIGIPWQRVAETGILAQITGELPSGRVIALRADIDALPILETNTHLDFKSLNEGVMHACGHDAHTTSLLGVAMILYEMRSEFGGTVKLIFQPAEEKLPGGALGMIAAGVLENPSPELVIGQHVMPELEAGKLGIMSGKYMASMDEIYMTVRGKGGHGAQPHTLIDPVLIASNMIVSLQQVVSRHADPKNPSVLSFGKFIANGSVNVVPDEVLLEGTFRTMNESWRTVALDKITTMSQALAAAMGATCTVNITRGYPCLINEPAATELVRKSAVEFFREDNVVLLDPWMAAEDFAYYAQQRPACFYRLGTGNSNQGIASGLHTSSFDIDETSLVHGAGFMAFMALSCLRSEVE